MVSALRALLAKLRGRPPEPDWPRIDNYSELYGLARRTRFRDPSAFLDGPFERFLDLVEAAPGRGGARIMEHASASLAWFRRSEAEAGRPTDALDSEADARVRARFASGSDNDAYMIEVFEGRATHNYRASDEDEEDDQPSS